jgi:predicted transcriptional regulator
MEEIRLTRAEEQIMQILWHLKTAYVKDIIEKMPTPVPAYNTVSTIVRILESKGYIGHEAIGKSHKYYPMIAENEYKQKYFKAFLKNYFSDSFHQLVSFFANEKEITPQEMEAMLEIMQKELNKQKTTKK